MPTIAHTVEHIIRRKPFLQEAMVRDIINYGALADEMIDEIKNELRQEVNHAAVMMALRRLREKLESQKIKKIKFNEDCAIIARDGLVEITVEKTDENIKKVRELIDNHNKRDFTTVTNGVHESTLIMNKSLLKEFLKHFPKQDIISVIEDISAVTLTIPQEFSDLPGFFYIVTRAMAWENINIPEIVSTQNELTLIVKSNDVTRTFNVLKQLIAENN